MNSLKVNLTERSYEIFVGHGLLEKAAEFFDLNRKVFVLTDSGVPAEYAKAVASCCKDAKIFTVQQGEGAKTFPVFEEVLREMMHFNMGRKDCLVCVGGGVVGDLGGFVAASYMRGIDFYQVPTTVLSQVDSSIGGKTAINLDDTKNIVGAFHQPKAVLIDIETLRTLPQRLIAEGLAEAVKMAACFDPELFEIFETQDIDLDNIEEVIMRSLAIKKKVVEEDEREAGLRKLLNFGHTLGHGIEGSQDKLFHGECVAIGMLPMCSDEVRPRLEAVLEKLGLPTKYDGDMDEALKLVAHDKKASGDFDEIGKPRIEKVSLTSFRAKRSK
mgnify:CR=1 FL=1